jgi:hypothetical protein
MYELENEGQIEALLTSAYFCEISPSSDAFAAKFTGKHRRPKPDRPGSALR